MTILLSILYIILGLIVLLLAVALFIPKKYRVSRELVINQPRAEVFDYARMIKNQEKYSVWVMRDPNVNIIYSGTDGAVGGKSSWTSNDKRVGVGEQEIMKIVENEKVETEIRFKVPFESVGLGETIVSDAPGGGTLLKTVFSGNSKYPFNLMNLMMDGMLGKDMLQNLQNLKKNMEV